jgi:hypothetical protein
MPRTYTDPPELAHMSGQFKIGYRQGREDAQAEIDRLRAGLQDVYHYAAMKWPEADDITDKIEELLR